MSKQKHTPGPWEWQPNTHTIIASGLTVAALRLDCGEESTVEGQANARLIAAAPELLEACKELSLMAEHLLTPQQKLDGSVQQAFVRTNTAIAKATT